MISFLLGLASASALRRTLAAHRFTCVLVEGISTANRASNTDRIPCCAADVAGLLELDVVGVVSSEAAFQLQDPGAVCIRGG